VTILTSREKSRDAALVAAICLLAFVLRYLYIASLDHLLCQFGDAYFFLAGASKLREFICNTIQAGNFNLIGALPPASTNGMVALGSLVVSDRLMVDGPIFPSYLALVQWLVGLAPGSLMFDTKAVQISLVNAVLDCFTCLFIYLGTRAAFGRRAAAIAALLFAVYPASIINVQSCYTEPFGCFILAAWSWLILKAFAKPAPAAEAPLDRNTETESKSKLAHFFLLGTVTGILALTRPPFVFLPVGFGVLLLALRLGSGEGKAGLNRHTGASALSVMAGLVIVLLPWLNITHQATGHYSLCVNRVPAFNLFLGNQLPRDGWRAYPFPENIPETVGVTAAQILEQAKQAPLAFVSMELRKIPRLWLGIWNEFQYTLFGIPVGAQEILHQVLLTLATLGLLFLITSKKRLQDHDAALSLVLAVLAVQSLYLAFEPISRYTMTAMPIVVMLVGYVIDLLYCKSRPASLTLPLTITVLIIAMNRQREMIAFAASFLPSPYISVFVAALCVLLMIVAYFIFQKIMQRCALSSPLFSLVSAGTLALLALLTVTTVVGNPEMSEWKATLTIPDQAVRQEIIVPQKDASTPAGNAYLLLDMAQGQCPAPLNLVVNNAFFTARPLPWWQIRPNKDFLDALALQERAMSMSRYAYRQWYLVPLPASLLKYGASNTVTLAPTGAAPLTIYGDYVQPGQTKSCLPSLQLASWTKAFCTYDHQDGRVYEKIPTGQMHSSSVSHFSPSKSSESKWQDGDLSSEPGKQTGNYRIHLIVFPDDQKAAQLPEERKTVDHNILISIPAERTISGADPTAMILEDSPVSLSAQAFSSATERSQNFQIECQLSSPSGRGWAFIGVQFTGHNAAGAEKKWTSSWQPYAIKTSRDWLPFYFSDTVPAEILRLNKLHVSVTICPFYADMLQLHQKQAIKGKVAVKELTLTLSPSSYPSQSASLNTKIY
jgi:4-amino-4-deoxy-L-arabinose transferase-like glycosyltransferase